MTEGRSLFFLVCMILLVHHTDLGRATSGNVNGSLTTTTPDSCGGSVNCLIGGGDGEFQMMSSHVARMLADGEFVTENYGIKDASVVSCPDNKYTSTSCLDTPRVDNRQQVCGTFTRGGCVDAR